MKLIAMKGSCRGEPSCLAGGQGAASYAIRTSSMGRSLIRPATGSGRRGEDLFAVGDDQSAAHRMHRVHRSVHRNVVAADDDQVVVIVRDGAGDRAVLQADALNEAKPDVAGAAVALDDRHLQEVARRVGDGLVAVDCCVEDEVVGDELILARADDANLRSVARRYENWNYPSRVCRNVA